MQIDPDALPDDAAALQQMLRAVLLQQSELHAENDKLRLLIQRLTRHQFGRRSEQLSLDQLQLGIEDLEQTIAANQAAQEALASGARRPRAEPPARNHGALPAHLPRYEVVIDIESRDCPCCGVALTPIGELRTEQLDIVPAQLRVRVTRRPRYACRGCEEAAVIAPAPDRPVDGGMPTEALVAHVVVSKFAEAANDGIYVVRTSLPAEALDEAAVVRSYKSLSLVERAFRCIKTVDLQVRPVHHWLADRVRAHVCLCMLAYYLEWHMRLPVVPRNAHS